MQAEFFLYLIFLAGTVLVNALRTDIVKFHQLSGGSIEAVGMLFSECKNYFLFVNVEMHS
jgi:hypothetical protein